VTQHIHKFQIHHARGCEHLLAISRATQISDPSCSRLRAICLACESYIQFNASMQCSRIYKVYCCIYFGASCASAHCCGRKVCAQVRKDIIVAMMAVELSAINIMADASIAQRMWSVSLPSSNNPWKNPYRIIHIEEPIEESLE
jgi:hypothetical protein